MAMRLAWTGSLLVAMIPALAIAASVEPTAFADKAFCEKMMTLFGARLELDAEVSQTVQWRPVELRGQEPPVRHCSSLDKAHLDIDNDGREDLVVKATFCPKGMPSDSFYIFPAHSAVLDEASWQDLSPLLATPNKFARTGGSYPLTSLQGNTVSMPLALTGSFSLHPFLVDGVTYVGLTDAQREWLVIARYQGGERFEDLCYLHAKL